MPKSVVSKLGKRRPRDKVMSRWSYSAWACMKSCALKYYYAYIRGERGPPVPAMARGIEIHRLAEYFLQRKINGLPYELKKLKPEYLALQRAKPIVEQFWGVSEKWKPKGRDSWCVMKMDAALAPTRKEPRLWIQDLKTGREYASHEDQGSLYASIGLAMYPDLEGVDVEFWYADQPVDDNTRTFRFKLIDVKDAVEHWRKEGADIMEPKKIYYPSPTEDACKWCHLRSDKGGPCDAWKVVKALRR